MIEQVINFSIRYRWLVLLAAFGVAGLGAYEFQHLPIDAVPDITNVQVQINTAAYGLSACRDIRLDPRMKGVERRDFA